MKKKLNVVCLPTEKASKLFVGKKNEGWIIKGELYYLYKIEGQIAYIKPPKGEVSMGYSQFLSLTTASELYFTAPSIEEDKENGEKIKMGEFVIVTDRYTKEKKLDKMHPNYAIGYFVEKVIATTNPELWSQKCGGLLHAVNSYGVEVYKCNKCNQWDLDSTERPKSCNKITQTDVPKIPTDFIEVFVKEQGEIEKVNVEYGRVDALKNIRYDRPKLNNNGSVKVFKVEEKKFTREEVKILLNKFDTEYADTTPEQFSKFIEQNL